jgi:hypothetical protein
LQKNLHLGNIFGPSTHGHFQGPRMARNDAWTSHINVPGSQSKKKKKERKETKTQFFEKMIVT